MKYEIHLVFLLKHVIIGFYENVTKILSINTLILYVAYKIYNFKMYCVEGFFLDETK